MSIIRRPAEFEPLERVWISAPHNRETWPGPEVLEKAQAQFGVFVTALNRVVDVVDVATLGIVTEDSWIRDYGPCFVIEDEQLIIRDFGFNAWGNKYGDGSVDHAVPEQIARSIGVTRTVESLVLEGGAIESDGQGTGMTTASCLFHPTRNPELNRETIIDHVTRSLGFKRLIILPGGDIEGDDTDGHIDNLARFLSPDIIAISTAEPGDPACETMKANARELSQHRRSDGQAYELVPLPVPNPIAFDYPGDAWTEARTISLPASYANFLMANGSVFVPTFGQASDDVACRRLEEALGSAWRVVAIRSEWLVVGQGGLHCLTQQQPATTCHLTES